MDFDSAILNRSTLEQETGLEERQHKLDTRCCRGFYFVPVIDGNRTALKADDSKRLFRRK